MANKTGPTTASVDDFLDQVANPHQRAEAHALRTLAEEITGEPAVMWGPSIVGFGHFVATYASGREVEWMRFGFSPRKANTVVYAVAGTDRLEPLLTRLGSPKTGVSCIYLKRLSDHEPALIRELVVTAVAQADASIAEQA